MLASDFVSGRDYVWSPTPKSAENEMHRVKYLGSHRAGKAKVRWADGEFAGLDEWIPTRRMLCPWKDRASFLRDRERERALEAVAREELDRVVADAIGLVLEATGEDGYFVRQWVVEPGQAARLWQRAGLPGDPSSESGAYRDRFGELHLSCRTALRFAQAFATAEPDVVIPMIQDGEDELRAEGFTPNGRLAHRFLREVRPAHALVRQWAGSAEVDMLRVEVERLRRVAESAIRELEHAGHDVAARRVRRELNGR